MLQWQLHQAKKKHNFFSLSLATTTNSQWFWNTLLLYASTLCNVRISGEICYHHADFRFWLKKVTPIIPEEVSFDDGVSQFIIFWLDGLWSLWIQLLVCWCLTIVIIALVVPLLQLVQFGFGAIFSITGKQVVKDEAK